MEIRYSIIFLALTIVTAFAAPGFEAKSIKQFPLDERTVYQIKIARDQVTTISFPGKISALEVAGVTADPQAAAPVMLNFKDGRYFFSVRALTEKASANVNVIWNRKTYVLKLYTDKDPFNSVTFIQPSEPVAGGEGKGTVGPSKLLGLLDRAKSFPLIQAQYPELVSQIAVAQPRRRMLYKDFDVVLEEVYRFDAEDTLVFKVLFVNNSEREIYYQPQTLAVRVGDTVYFSALSDASGIMPPGYRDPKSEKIKPSVSLGYFAIAGTPNGGRNNLSVDNRFNVIVNRQAQGLATSATTIGQ